jgi:hypothetical protein
MEDQTSGRIGFGSWSTNRLVSLSRVWRVAGSSTTSTGRSRFDLPDFSPLRSPSLISDLSISPNLSLNISLSFSLSGPWVRRIEKKEEE